MALSNDTRTLKVPSAGLLAKNMRALETSPSPSAARTPSSSQHQNAASYFMGIGAHIESSQLKSNPNIRFKRAPDDSQPNPVIAAISKLFNRSKDSSKTQKKNGDDKSAINKKLQKILPTLEKAATIASRFPDPTILFLALVLTILLIDRLRPHWLQPLLVKIAVTISFFPLFVLALLWRKTELFAMIREGQNPLSHPAEHHMDDLEAELLKREEKIKAAQETLKKNRGQLDALRKELAKDPNAHDPEAIILPSQKAAEMIRAGALGAGYDEEAAQAVEQRRREESVKRCREEWRAKTEEADHNIVQTQQNVRILEAHAATAYNKRTKDMKTKSSVVATKAVDRLLQSKKTFPLGRKEEEENRRASRQSERSTAASTVNSTGSKRRLRFFGGKKSREADRMLDGNPPLVESQLSGTAEPDPEST